MVDAPPPVDLSQQPLPEDDNQRYLSIQSQDIIIPSYAAWFDITKVDVIESRSLPEFFNSRNKSKTPAVYKEYRDFMINTYRMNPIEYLTITACRRNLMGDVCSILRVHAFLEQWGLINYQVDPGVKSSSVSPPFKTQFKIVIAKPEVTNSDKKEDIKEEEKDQDQIMASPKIEFNQDKTPQICSSCNNACTQVQYCSTAKQEFYLCRDCYVQGKYPLELDCSKFIIQHLETKEKENDGDVDDEEVWTEEEDALLKEGLGMYDDDWEKVADHIKTRTHEECVLRYLQLPMEDPIENEQVSKLGLLQYDQTHHDENPIMATVAFLASAVKPEVAAAAAYIDAIEIDHTLIPPPPEVKEDAEKVNESNKEETEGKEEEEGKNKKEEEDDKPKKSPKEENELCDLMIDFVRSKIKGYEQRTGHYEALEDIVEQEKRQLEKERQLLLQDQYNFEKQVLKIQVAMNKRSSSATAIANSITPAQLQQQLSGASPTMFMNGPPQQSQEASSQVLQQLHLQRQQQYQMQMQMQYQAQSAQGQPRLPGQGFNNMMSL
ncbi:SWIRM-domain-containing protein [Backusella circina FSU 941]|nr:SWIRM-domain-containing protein [Backusella circina FSU 941]